MDSSENKYSVEKGEAFGGRGRRSRYEKEGRDFKCQICDKMYLSYPAMYTHMKNKHSLDPSGAAFLQ